MTEIIMELSDEELPDYVNALLDQNRELREENARLRAEKDQFASVPTLTDYLLRFHGGSI